MALEIGQLLTEKKAELKHGEFGKWITDNLAFTDRTARNYMRLYENKDKILQSGSISEAYQMLEAPKTETVSDLEQEYNRLFNLNPNDIESNVLDISREIVEFWKNASDNLPSNIEEFKDLDLSRFELIDFKMSGFFSIMDNEFKNHCHEVLNIPKATNREEWLDGLKKLSQLGKTLAKLQNDYGEIEVYRIEFTGEIENRQKLIRARLRELKAEQKGKFSEVV